MAFRRPGFQGSISPGGVQPLPSDADVAFALSDPHRSGTPTVYPNVNPEATTGPRQHRPGAPAPAPPQGRSTSRPVSHNMALSALSNAMAGTYRGPHDPGGTLGVPGEVDIPPLAGGAVGTDQPAELTPEEQLQADWRSGNYTPDLYDRAIPNLDARTGLDAITKTLALVGVDSVALNATGLDVGTALALDINRDGLIDTKDQEAWQRAVDAGGGGGEEVTMESLMESNPNLFGGGNDEAMASMQADFDAERNQWQEQMDRLNQTIMALMSRREEDEYALPSTYSIGGGF